MRALKTMLTVIGAVTVLVLAVNTAAFAATGSTFILGHVNKANKTSVLKRTTPGPALTLRTRTSTDAPLSVNGSGKVVNLNADQLDGLDSTALMNNVQVFTGVVSSGVASYTKQLPLAPGTYTISYSAYLSGGSGTSECYIRTHSPTNSTLGYVGDQTTSISSPAMSGTGLVTQDANHLNELTCFSGTAFTTIPSEPIQVLATKVDNVLSTSSLRIAPSGARVAK